MKYSDKDFELEIIYCDSHLLVVNKPAGLLTQKVPESQNDSLEELAKAWICKKFQKKTAFLHCVHRLDKGVSGFVLFARSSKALSRLNEQMREKKIIRKYFAVVEGTFPNSKKEGVLEHYLIHEEHYAKVGSPGQKDAKLARLFFRVIGEKKDQTLLEISLETGRYHQIRAQLAATGHPIVGDKKYGSRTDFFEIKLHQGYLEFSHPVTKERMVFESKPSFSF